MAKDVGYNGMDPISGEKERQTFSAERDGVRIDSSSRDVDGKQNTMRPAIGNYRYIKIRLASEVCWKYNLRERGATYYNILFLTAP